MELTGVILIGSNRSVLAMNAFAARLWDLEEGQKLQKLLFSTVLYPGSLDGQLVAIQRSGGRVPLLVWLTPLQVFSGPGDYRACLIFDLERQQANAAATLQVAFGFTAAELRLAEQLLLGRRPEEAAEALGVTIHTVRTYLKRLHHKVGVRSQATLVLRLFRAVSATVSSAA